jgi:hypothetical protein
MRRSHRRLIRRVTAGPRTGLVLLAGLLMLAALLAACSAQATTGIPSSGSPSDSSGARSDDGAVGAKAAAGADWSHALQVVANLQDDPPSEPVVVLFGGSAARESTISDSNWRMQIRAKGGGGAAAYNLGSRNRTSAQSVALVEAMPKVPTIVYIGVNLGSFTSAQKTAEITLPAAVTPLPPYKQHAYSQSHILSASAKKALVQSWLAERYPKFKLNYATSAAVLEKLVTSCLARGLRPVLFELPRNTAIIGHQLDAPFARTRKTCQTLAAKYKIPYVSLVAQAKLPNSSFYDLWHLVEPGRKVWQNLLSAKTAALLKQYGYDGGS